MLGDEIAGLIQLDLDRKVAQNAGYISFFYMRPGFRDHGFGVQMLGHGVSVCRSLGRAALQLSVSPQNQKAMRFYDRYGFEPIGKTAGFHGDLVLMEKKIDRTPFLLPSQQN